MIGYTYFKAAGLLWRENQGVIMPLSMPHRMSEMSEINAKRIMDGRSSLMIRWDSGFDKYDSSDWWYVIKDRDDGLESLSRNSRSKVRRGKKAFESRQCAEEDILHYGYDVYCSAFARYTTHEKCYDRNKFVQAIKSLPEGTEFWSVRDRVTGKMVAFSENFVQDNACLYNTIWFEPSGLKRYSAYALFYAMNSHYLSERKLKYVSDGARNLSHKTSIHDFLEKKFGFRKAYARLNVEYEIWLAILVFLLYPFRSILRKMPLVFFKKASVLLKQEEIRRKCAELSEING